MISDSRRAPFCYQTHDALAAIRQRFDGGKRATAIAIYVVLTETANRLGGEEARGGFEATRTQIASDIGCSVDTLDRYVAVFAEMGLLAIERRKAEGVNLPNRWRLLDGPGTPPSRTRAATPGRTGAAQGLEELEPQESVDPDGSTALAATNGGGGERPQTAQTLVADFVDGAAERSLPLPRRTIGQVAKYVGELLTDGIPYDAVEAGLRRMLERGQMKPALLANFVVEAALPRAGPQGRRYGYGVRNDELEQLARRLEDEGR